MDANFWHQKWANKDIGFHQSHAHPLLVNYFSKLNLPKNARVFLPLCGKTLDIHWLLAQGYQVAGAELSQLAVEELFAELDVRPQIKLLGAITIYSGPNLDIFVGDIFKLTAAQLGAVEAIYDRAALVALPESMRTNYAKHLVKLTHSAAQLLITFEYDQTLLDGPPFSVTGEQVQQLYSNSYHIQLLENQQMESPFKGKVEANELVWLLGPIE